LNDDSIIGIVRSDVQKTPLRINIYRPPKKKVNPVPKKGAEVFVFLSDFSRAKMNPVKARNPTIEIPERKRPEETGRNPEYLDPIYTKAAA
jgi:hypothetical protein